MGFIKNVTELFQQLWQLWLSVTVIKYMQAQPDGNASSPAEDAHKPEWETSCENSYNPVMRQGVTPTLLTLDACFRAKTLKVSFSYEYFEIANSALDEALFRC